MTYNVISPTVESNLPVVSTGSTTARTLANRFADAINLKDYGAVMDGTTDDTAAWQAAYNATPSGGTLMVPAGKYLTSGFTPTVGKSINYQMLGTLDYGTNAPGTSPVVSLGDGDVLSGYYAGRYNFWKTLTNSTSGYSTVNVGLTNNCDTASAGVASALVPVQVLRFIIRIHPKARYQI
jgi:hypothetical protein